MCVLKLECTFEYLKKQNEAKSALITKLQNQINSICAENLHLRNQCDLKDAEIHSKSTEIRHLKKQNCLLKNKNESLMSGKLPKTVTNKVIHENLNGKFTGAQIRRILKPVKKSSENGKKPIIRMSNITYDDYKVAMPIRCAGGKKCYNLLRNFNFPMPGLSTMDR